MDCIASTRVSVPNFPAISWVRRTPVTTAETWACRSPMVWLGNRLLNRTMLKMSFCISPRR